MRNIRLLIEYDGANYEGWQTQRSGRTIQDSIEKAILNITGEKVRLTGASRTDAGVHALGQVAAFVTQSNLPSEVIFRALNAKLPRDIRVLSAEDTDSNFHPRYNALKKSYFYIISAKSIQSAFLSPYVWDIKSDLDITGMEEAASCLFGEHDFTSFRGSGCGSNTTVRKIISIEITKLHEICFMTTSITGNFIKIRIEGNAFLRHMVRNITGTLAEIGKKKMSPERMRHILEACDRKLAGPTAPANALFLETITY